MNEKTVEDQILELHKLVAGIKEWMISMDKSSAEQSSRIFEIEKRNQEDAIMKAKERTEMLAFMEFVKDKLDGPKKKRAQLMEYTKFFVYIALFVLAIWKFSAIEVVQAEQLRAPQTERSVEK